MTSDDLEERVLAIFATLDDPPRDHVRALAFGI